VLIAWIGVLVVTETHFLQVLEGPFEPLNATFERIARDTRHEGTQLISFTEIKERRFADWAMHGIGLFDLNRELKSSLCLKFGEDNGTFVYPPLPMKSWTCSTYFYLKNNQPRPLSS